MKYIFSILTISLLLTGCGQNPTTVTVTPPAVTRVTNETTVTTQTNTALTTNINPVAAPSLVGSFRCWQYSEDGLLNSSGCRLAPPLVLSADGTYTMSSEHGTFTVSGDTINLSESKIRGPGTIKASGQQIYFKYPYNGRTYEVTYLLEDS